MADIKKIIIKLPTILINKVDDLVVIEEDNKSEIIKEAMEIYIVEQRKIQIREDMKKGYLEMSQINIKLSEMGLAEDIRELCVYETNLTGCGE